MISILSKRNVQRAKQRWSWKKKSRFLPAVLVFFVSTNSLYMITHYLLSDTSTYESPQLEITCSKLVSLLLTLNIFHTLLYCFYCLLWTGKCRLGLLPRSGSSWGSLIRKVCTCQHSWATVVISVDG